MQIAHPCCTSKIWMHLQEGDHTTGVILNPTLSLQLSASTCCGNNSYQNGKLTRAQNLSSYLAQEWPNAYSSFTNYHKPVLPQTVSSSKSMSKVGELPKTYLGTVFSWQFEAAFPFKTCTPTQQTVTTADSEEEDRLLSFFSSRKTRGHNIHCLPPSSQSQPAQTALAHK